MGAEKGDFLQDDDDLGGVRAGSRLASGARAADPSAGLPVGDVE